MSVNDGVTQKFNWEAGVHGAWRWLPVAAVAAVLAVAADEQPAIHGEHRRVGDLRGKHGTRRARGI